MQFLDAVKAFEDDLKAKVNIPVVNLNRNPEGPIMRLALNNADSDGQFLNSSARVLIGQFNVEISAPLGTNKYEMMRQANKVLSAYKRGDTLPVLDRRIVILQVGQSSIYKLEHPNGHAENINVIIDFQITK